MVQRETIYGTWDKSKFDGMRVMHEKRRERQVTRGDEGRRDEFRIEFKIRLKRWKRITTMRVEKEGTTLHCIHRIK